MLLEAAQQRRQAGPAADGHDPRPAREEPLLVDELDERRLSASALRNGSMNARITWTEPTTKIASPIPPTISPRSGYGRNWRVRVSMSEPERAAGLEVAGDLAEHVGDGQGEQQQAREDDQQPALDPDARASASGAGSCPLQLAVEDRDRPEPALAQPGRQLLGDDDRAVVAAGAADGDRQARLALRDVGRDREVEEVLQEREEAARDGLAEDELADGLGQAGQLAQLRARSTGSA